MSSRILTRASELEAPRFQWPGAGEQGQPASGVPATQRDTAGEAERRMRELQAQAEQRGRQARQEGYREGEAAGRAQASAEVKPVLDRLARAVQEIAGLRPKLMRESASELVDLSFGIARRILHRELTVDRGALQGLVAGALEQLAAQEIVRIRVHPELEAGIRQALEGAGRGGLRLTSDQTLERGAVLLETARGTLDASLETQLAEIGRGLADRIPER